MALTRDALFWDAFNRHAALSVQAAKQLEAMLQNPANSQEAANAIKQLESAGDAITHDTVHALHQTWITPLDRDAIYGLVSKLDDVLDFIESASERISLYEVQSAPQEAIDLAAVLTVSTEEVVRAVAGLTNLKDAKPILDLCKSINKLEHDADSLYRRGIARLFKEEKDPITVLKWRDIYESIETATDRTEDVANIIEGIVLEHA
jgi:uncharacterized protein